MQKCTFFSLQCKIEISFVFTLIFAISKRKKDRNTRLAPNESIFRGLSNDLERYYVFFLILNFEILNFENGIDLSKNFADFDFSVA